MYVTEGIICLVFLKPKNEELGCHTLLDIRLDTFRASRPSSKQCTQLCAESYRGRTGDIQRNKGKEVVHGAYF